MTRIIIAVMLISTLAITVVGCYLLGSTPKPTPNTLCYNACERQDKINMELCIDMCLEGFSEGVDWLKSHQN